MKDPKLADILQAACLNPFYYEIIDEAILDGLCRFAVDGIRPGGFLSAVLENDLFESMKRADAENFAALRELMIFVHQELPAPCWGSRKKVAKWIDERQAERQDALEQDGGFVDRDAPANAVKGDLP